MRYLRVLLTAVLMGVGLTAPPQALAASDGARSGGSVVWTREFGTENLDEALGVAVDASGVYITGRTRSPLPGQTQVGGSDVFVRKYDHDGAVQWTRQFGTALEDYGHGVAVDDSGVYVTGRVGGALPGQTHIGRDDVFVRKYDHDGVVQWTRQFGTSESDAGYGVAVGPAGVYVTGSVRAALPGQAHLGGDDGFLRKYTRDGGLRWTSQFGTPHNDLGFGVALDDLGVYVAGQAGGMPGDPAFVRKWSHGGTERWTREFGTSGYDNACALAVHPSGVYVTGYVEGPLSGQTHQGERDGFLRVYTAAGKHRWTRQFGADLEDQGLGVAVNDSGVYVTGRTELPLETTYYDVFVRSYSHTGDRLWARQFGSIEAGSQTAVWDEGRAVAADSSTVYIAGFVGGALPKQTYEGLGDVFLRTYAAA